MTKDPKDTEQRLFYHLLSSVITPRPIALVSSIDASGNENLAPFSFFNMVSVNPPILVFSPLNRMRNNTKKDTLNNVKSCKEAVINIIAYDQVGQMNIAGGEYESSVNEFEKSGFEIEKSIKVSPSRIKNAIASFECKVNDVIALGPDGGAGNLVICEVVLAHFNDDILDSENTIMINSFVSVGRLGKSFYTKGDVNSRFQIDKGGTGVGVGWDQIPVFIKQSSILTGNEISMLASIDKLPSADRKQPSITDERKVQQVKKILSEGNVKQAWIVILS